MKKLYASAALLLAAIIWGFCVRGADRGDGSRWPLYLPVQPLPPGCADPGAGHPGLRQPQEEAQAPIARFTQAEKKTLLKGGLACGVS